MVAVAVTSIRWFGERYRSKAKRHGAMRMATKVVPLNKEEPNSAAPLKT